MINDLRIAVLIPTRGDRPEFLQQCFKLLDRQTLPPAYIKLMDYAPESAACDITQRYRRGYSELSRQNHCDVIALIEDDDYYRPEYLEVMAREWLQAGRPDLCGTAYTYYYHLKLRKYVRLNHPSRASAMNTLIKPGLNINWCQDDYAFTDLHLWNMSTLAQQRLPEVNRLPKNTQLSAHLFCPEKPIALGMKHGVGLSGGRMHIDRLERFDKTDKNAAFLTEVVDEQSRDFYLPFFTPAANHAEAPAQ
jgi:hypothetical protein